MINTDVLQERITLMADVFPERIMLMASNAKELYISECHHLSLS